MNFFIKRSIFLHIILFSGCTSVPTREVHQPYPNIIVSRTKLDLKHDQVWVSTLSEAVKMAQAGDLVHVKEGVYNEKLHISKTASAGHPIVFKAVGKVILDGDKVTKLIKDEEENKKRVDALVRIENSSFIELEGFELRNSKGFGLDIHNSSFIKIKNCHIHHTWSRGLGGSGNNLQFVNNSIHNVVLQNKDERTLKTPERDFWSSAAATWYLPNGDLSSNIVWKDNVIHDSWGEGLNVLHAENVIVSGNIVFNAYSVILYIDHSQNVVVENNLLFLNTLKYLRSDIKDFAIGIGMASEHYKGTKPAVLSEIEIKNNVIANAGYGIAFWRDPNNKSKSNFYQNVRIKDNLIYNIFNIGISFNKVDQLSSGNELTGNFIAEPFMKSVDRYEPTIRIGNLDTWKIQNNTFEQHTMVDLGHNFISSIFTRPPPKPRIDPDFEHELNSALKRNSLKLDLNLDRGKLNNK